MSAAGTLHGTLSATGAAFAPGGVSGNAISLDRTTGGFVNMGTSFPGFTSGNYSIILWVRTTTTELDTLALSKHNAGSENGYFVNINPTGGGGAPNKAGFVASSFVSQGVHSTTSVNDGLWHQIVGVYQAGIGESIFVDGAPLEATGATNAMIANTAPFLIGGVNQAGTPVSRYSGLIDEVEIYNHALSDAEVQARFVAVPEPEAVALLMAGMVGLAATRRRNSAASKSHTVTQEAERKRSGTRSRRRGMS